MLYININLSSAREGGERTWPSGVGYTQTQHIPTSLLVQYTPKNLKVFLRGTHTEIQSLDINHTNPFGKIPTMC